MNGLRRGLPTDGGLAAVRARVRVARVDEGKKWSKTGIEIGGEGVDRPKDCVLFGY